MEELKDPLNDRQIKNVLRPPSKPMPLDIMVQPYSRLPSWELIRDHFKNQGSLTKTAAIFLVSQAMFLFETEKNLLDLQDPISIVGDIHGQYYDLLRILEIGGDPNNTSYLFLGDYVDRGVFSVEVILLLYALKINHPKTIHILRGNHECRHLTSHFNFRQEVLHKYDLETYELIMESFDCMPLACILNKKFFCVHGGISPELETLRDIEVMNRFIESPSKGLLCDLLWSDPTDTAHGCQSEAFKYNEKRNCSFVYGYNATKAFLKNNNLKTIIRAHEAYLDGYQMYWWSGFAKFPTVITVFSAPNYCDVYRNKGAIIKLVNSEINIEQYRHSHHPYHLPQFLDAFSWSIPFIIEKILEAYTISLKKAEDLKYCGTLEEEKINLEHKIKQLSKILFIAKTRAEENENTKYGANAEDKSVGFIRKWLTENTLTTHKDIFTNVREKDLRNEGFPELK